MKIRNSLPGLRRLATLLQSPELPGAEAEAEVRAEQAHRLRRLARVSDPDQEQLAEARALLAEIAKTWNAGMAWAWRAPSGGWK